MKTFKRINVFVLALCILLLSSCNKDNESQIEPTPTPTASTAPIVPTFGETLKLSIRNPVTLNPLLNEEPTVDQVLKLVFEPLFTIDSQYKPTPHLVDYYSVAQDNSYISLTLKSDLAFNNGEPLTAYDVQYSIEVLQEAPDTSIYKSCVDNIQRTSVTDNQTIKIYFKQPYAFATYYLTFPIISSKDTDSANYDPFKPVGSGHYEIKNFTSMKTLNLTASNQHKDKVYIENIEVTITRDSDVEKNAFDQNLIDMIFPTRFNWFEHSESGNQKSITYTTNYFEFIGFNFSNQWLNNVVIRQAIANSINREEIAQKQYLSQVVITDSPVHPNSWLNPANNNLVYKYDSNQAKNLLKSINLIDSNKDGFYDQSTGNTTENITFKLLVNIDNPSRVKVAEMIQEYMKNVGLFVEIDAVDRVTFNDKLKAGNYDLVLTGWKLSVVPDYTNMFHSTQIENATNFIRYNNPLMDQALANTFNSADETALYANFQAFRDLYVQDLPYFSLYFMNSIVQTNSDVYGELNPTTENVFYGIESLYISRQ